MPMFLYRIIPFSSFFFSTLVWIHVSMIVLIPLSQTDRQTQPTILWIVFSWNSIEKLIECHAALYGNDFVVMMSIILIKFHLMIYTRAVAEKILNRNLFNQNCCYREHHSFSLWKSFSQDYAFVTWLFIICDIHRNTLSSTSHDK